MIINPSAVGVISTLACTARFCIAALRLCPEGDAASVGAAGAESCREGKAGALSAEWSLAWPERLDQTRYEGRTGEDRRV